MESADQWDVFLSHSSKDKPQVEQLKSELASHGLRVWLDEERITAGKSIPAAIEQGIEQSHAIVICLSPDFLESEWTRAERAAFTYADPGNVRTTLIPVLLRDCSLPKTLQHLKHVDYKTPSKQAVEEIVAAVTAPQGATVSAMASPDTDYLMRFSLDSMDVTALNSYIASGLSGSREDDAHAFAFRADDPSTATRNALTRWHAHGASAPFQVSIDDKRVTILRSALDPIDQRLAADETLSVGEAVRYQNGMMWLRRLDQQQQIRKHAVEAFFRDKSVQGLLWMTQPQDLLDFAGRILNMPIPAPNDVPYTPFDVITNSKFPGDHDYFIVYLPRDLVDAAVKKDPILQFKDYVLGWSTFRPAFEEIVIQYYLSYVGKKVVEQGRHELETEDFLTGVNSTITAWEIGPH